LIAFNKLLFYKRFSKNFGEEIQRKP
jgi:hypothetical protein